MGEKYVVALDQGTTSCRAVVFDGYGRIVGKEGREFRQIYSRPGWVEHDAEEIWECQLSVLRKVLDTTGIKADDIAAIGITNQRETVVVWNRHTGKPIYNAIVWQCRRTAPLCDELKQRGLEDIIKKKTGLVIDAYFFATKICWILENVDGANQMAQAGDLLAGTMDTWLIWKLTGGKVFATDYTNASRTMLYNIDELCWDEELLKELDIPPTMLPEVKESSGFFGMIDSKLLGREIPITGVAGDQQAALFGQACFERGMVKNTYGTGCFILMNTGKSRIASNNNLLTTIAWGIGGEIEYALEGSVFIAGAVIQWLRDELKLIENVAESEKYANRVKDTNDVYVVPAFVGLGAPYWDMYARGAILGITRGVNRDHIVRAALESIAYQTMDVIEAMQQDSGIPLKALKVDGGACANNFLMQFQSDILGVPVIRPQNIEVTAQGAAFLAGLEAGVWKDTDALKALCVEDRTFYPNMSAEERARKYAGWKKAVRRSMNWMDAD
nr:MAG: glycerol kinase [Caldicoprobacter oshimai]